MLLSNARSVLDLEIRIFRTEGETGNLGSSIGPFPLGPGFYRAELGYGDGRLSPFDLGPIPILQQGPISDPLVQGQILFNWLFGQSSSDEMKNTLWDLMDHSGPNLFDSDPKHLRLRLNLDSRDPELHALNWETMREASGNALPISIQTAFSRFLRVRAARAWPISERPLRMLTVVSNPSGLADFDLSRFDEHFHKQMLANAARPLGSLLDIGKPIYNPTISDFQAVWKAEARRIHILHIVSHSVIEGDRAFLLLADKNGSAEMVPAEVIRDIIKSIASPNLVFLAAPTTPGQPEGAGLLRLAPMLLASGVQAVVVIPGTMRQDQLTTFTESFYEVLLRTGTIDRAVSEARRQLFHLEPVAQDWSRPVLYMRTPDGQLFVDLSPAFENSISNIAFGA
jgi:CHAT domain-containing protein